jgi:hypothetical protein
MKVPAMIPGSALASTVRAAPMSPPVMEASAVRISWRLVIVQRLSRLRVSPQATRTRR